MPGLAQGMAAKLECAVLAMRYSAGERFAADLSLGLYQGLLEARSSRAETHRLSGIRGM
ncbi:MAG: hypothetical protein GY862_36870 [Gammaproteobacteria bacterium]|nr:hypothetical protein [Gammaproteobacteria bacterium]